MTDPVIIDFLFECLVQASTMPSRLTPPPPGYQTYKRIIRDKQTEKWVINNLGERVLHHTPFMIGKNKFDMYRISYSRNTEAKFKQSGTFGYLYHGSPIYNWHSILNNGIKVMSGTSGQANGAVHGSGVYVTDLLSRSMAYTACNSVGVIGVYEVYNPEIYRKHQDIHVIPSSDLLMLRFLIVLPVNIPINILGDNFNKLMSDKAEKKKKAQAKRNKKREKRIKKEVEMSGGNYQNSTLIANGKSITFPPGFPIDSFLVDGSAIKNWKPDMHVVDYIA